LYAYTNRVDHVLKSELHKIHLASELWELNCSLSWGMSVHNVLHMSLSSHIYHIKPLSFSSTTRFMFNYQWCPKSFHLMIITIYWLLGYLMIWFNHRSHAVSNENNWWDAD